MATRDVPLSAEDVYEARGVVPLAKPIAQGDVFQGINIPGFDQRPAAVMIVQHPCSMRAGSKLRPRLTVAVVSPRAKIREEDWQGYGWAMLLPDMLGDGTDHHADFREVASVKTSYVDRTNRIAALTNYGINVLQQRHTYYQTRFTIDIPTLAETFEPVATELELQHDWVEAALEAELTAKSSDPALETIHRAELEFGGYLDENDRALRSGLQDSAARADTRRTIRREIARRYSSR